VRSSVDAAWLEVTIARCCVHFYIGRINPCDGRQATLFVTNPRVESDHARTLLRADSVGASHEVLLHGWIESSFMPHHSLSAVDRPETPAIVISKLHGTFLLQLTERKLVSTFLSSGQACWAINCPASLSTPSLIAVFRHSIHMYTVYRW
jgi:hypothetical protein